KKPSALDIKAGGDAKRKATFVAEPLERGYGLTLGPSTSLGTAAPGAPVQLSGCGDHLDQDRDHAARVQQPRRRARPSASLGIGRPESERDQGSAELDGPAAGDGHPRLAPSATLRTGAGEHRGD